MLTILNYLFWICVGGFLSANFKNLFGVWHVSFLFATRVSIAMLADFYITLQLRIFCTIFDFGRHHSRRVDVSKDGLQAIFLPVVTSSHSPLLECDYNLHKSNSTYFTDLDVNHTKLISNLFKDILRPPRKEVGASKDTGRLVIALGGVACTFRMEIKPYEKYEIWTRVLCWDEKWLYVVSHFVKPGAFKPVGHAAQDSGTLSLAGLLYGNHVNNGTEILLNEKMIFATSMAKYVFKRGRMTVPPRSALAGSRLVPDAGSAFGGQTSLDPLFSTVEIEEVGNELCKGSKGKWTLAQVEEQNRRGLKIALHFAELASLHKTFTTGAPTPAEGMRSR
jgi:hypothetical protein